MSAQQAGTASAAGTAGMGVLLLRVEHQRNAVLVHTGEVIAALLLYQFQEQLAADQSEVAGYNGIKVTGLLLRCMQVADNGICRSWRHR